MKTVFTLIGVALGVCILATVAVTLFSIYVPTPRGLEGADLTIESGTSVKTLAHELKESKFIHSETVFKWYMRLTGRAGKIKAGTYVVAQRATLIDIVNQITDPFAKGTGNSDVRLTIIEGWDTDDVLAELQRQGLPSDGVTAFQTEITRKRETAHDETFAGKPEATDLSGYLYPDTYFFKHDATAEDIIGKIFDHFESKLTPERIEKIKASSLSFYEVLTLASIVEKEVSNSVDRKVVAGIFLQRLSDSYPLQSDATVNFVTKKNTTRPSAKDLDTDSLYNTYAHAGLPPTPICNPGITAIDAVLDPTPSNYYFFLTTPEGEAIYSETYQQHLKATHQYYGN